MATLKTLVCRVTRQYTLIVAVTFALVGGSCQSGEVPWLTTTESLDRCTIGAQEYWRGLRGTMVICQGNVIPSASPLFRAYWSDAKRNVNDWKFDPNFHNPLSLDIGAIQLPITIWKKAGSDTLYVQRESRTYLFHFEPGN